MHRLHLDDLRYSMPPEHFAFLQRWLEQCGALIVVPDDIRVPHQSMGNFDRVRGRWGVDEPYPPYGRERQLFEDAAANPPKGNAEGSSDHALGLASASSTSA